MALDVPGCGYGALCWDGGEPLCLALMVLVVMLLLLARALVIVLLFNLGISNLKLDFGAT